MSPNGKTRNAISLPQTPKAQENTDWLIDLTLLSMCIYIYINNNNKNNTQRHLDAQLCCLCRMLQRCLSGKRIRLSRWEIFSSKIRIYVSLLLQVLIKNEICVIMRFYIIMR